MSTCWWYRALDPLSVFLCFLGEVPLFKMSKKFRNVEMLKSKPFFESVSRKVYGTHSFRLFNHPNPVLEKDHVLRSEEEP